MSWVNLLLPEGARLEGPFRHTGRSTAQGLRLLAQAISSPGTKVDIFDHHGTKDADFHLANMIDRMVTNLDLRYVEVKRRDHEPTKYYVVSNHIKEIS